jgi:hypothetical protein
VTLHHFLDEFQRCGLVPDLGDLRFQDFTLVVNRPPKVVHLANNLFVDLIEASPLLVESPDVLDAPSADLGRDHRTDAVPPQPHSLVEDVDAALEQQVLDVAQRQRVADVHYDDQPADLRLGFKMAGGLHTAMVAPQRRRHKF